MNITRNLLRIMMANLRYAHFNDKLYHENYVL